MKVLCEQYEKMKTKYECHICEHAIPHEYNEEECKYDVGCSDCGCCNIKPLRKQKLIKIYENI
jgi:peptide subunit release factor 1 (eRF1)